MICVGAGTQHKKRKKNSRPKFLSSTLCDQNFSSAFACGKKHQSPFLSTLSTRQRKRRRRNLKITYALFVPFLRLFFSLFSLSLFVPMLRFLRVRILSLSPLRLCARLCARVCVCLERPDLRLGVLFPNHKFSSRARSRTDFVLYHHHLFIQFAASAPATSADRPWP